jgi:hypothetical protein
LHPDHPADRIALEVGHHQDAARGGDAEHRERGLEGLARDVADDHARRLGEAPLQAEALEHRRPVHRRGLGPHALRGRQGRRPVHGEHRAGQRGDQGDQDRLQEDERVQLEVQVREAVELLVDAAQPLGEPQAERDPRRQAESGDRQHQAGVVHADLPGRVAEGLQGADLLALGRDQPGDDDVQQEGRHAEKDHREDRRHGLEAAQLLGNEAVAELVLAGVRPEAAVARQHEVDALNHALRGGAALQGERDVVERPVHVEGRREGLAVHPQDPVALVVGKQRAGRDRVHVLRRQGDPDDVQPLAMSLDDRDDRRSPGWKPWAAAKSSLMATSSSCARRREPAAPQVGHVEPRRAGLRQGEDLAGHRIVEALDLQVHGGHDASLDLVDAWQLRELFRHRLRGAHEVHEHLGEALVDVIAHLRDLQRLVRHARHDERRDSRRS